VVLIEARSQIQAGSLTEAGGLWQYCSSTSRWLLLEEIR